MNITKEEEELIKAYRRTNNPKYELNGWDWYFNSTGVIQASTTNSCRLAGTERETKEAAERGRKRSRAANRISALADELGGEVDGAHNYHIYNNDGEWFYSYTDMLNPGMVYMTEECAEEIINMLNNGKFVI